MQAYTRRWHIELTFRFAKSELGIESIRVRKPEARLKLLGRLPLAFAFLLSLLQLPAFQDLWNFLVRWWCHRTGAWTRHTIPFYRLRSALSRLWSVHLPFFAFSFHYLLHQRLFGFFQNSG